jgi:hypothetical protein
MNISIYIALSILIMIIFFYVMFNPFSGKGRNYECDIFEDCGDDEEGFVYACVKNQCKTVECRMNSHCPSKNYICNSHNQCEEKNRTFYIEKMNPDKTLSVNSHKSFKNGYYIAVIYIALVDAVDTYSPVSIRVPVKYTNVKGYPQMDKIEVLTNTYTYDINNWTDAQIDSFNTGTKAKESRKITLYDLECRIDGDCTSVGGDFTCDLTQLSGIDGYPGLCVKTGQTGQSGQVTFGWTPNQTEGYDWY